MTTFTHYLELSFNGLKIIRTSSLEHLITIIHDHNHYFKNDPLAITFSKDDDEFDIKTVRCVGTKSAIERALQMCSTHIKKLRLNKPLQIENIPSNAELATFKTLDRAFYSENKINKKAKERQRYLSAKGINKDLPDIVSDLHHKAALKLANTKTIQIKLFSKTQQRNISLFIAKENALKAKQTPTIHGLKCAVPVF